MEMNFELCFVDGRLNGEPLKNAEEFEVENSRGLYRLGCHT